MTQGELIDEKTEGQKSRDTVPLTILLLLCKNINFGPLCIVTMRLENLFSHQKDNFDVICKI
jgi:hypothetical protein